MTTKTTIVYASLAGDAEQVAKDTVEVLDNDELGPVEFPALKPTDLELPQDIMFVVSTYNWGEPPGSTYNWFAKHIWRDVYHNEVWDWKKLNLAKLRFSMAALGDKSYNEEYCLFGKNLTWWLKDCGATMVGELVMVDQCDERDIQRWFEIAKQHWKLANK